MGGARFKVSTLSTSENNVKQTKFRTRGDPRGFPLGRKERGLAREVDFGKDSRGKQKAR